LAGNLFWRTFMAAIAEVIAFLLLGANVGYSNCPSYAYDKRGMA
jgi:hypothetical protein